MKPVEFFFDYASPFAYLASELLARKLPGISVQYAPIYLRGLESFSKGIPYGFAKSLYVVRDLQRCAEHEQIKTIVPKTFPINGLHMVRAALVAQDLGRFDEVHRALFHAAWRDAREVSDQRAVLEVLAEAGVDPAVFGERMEAPEVKQRLKDQTARAQERGVFGVPSFFVGSELFWGVDRMDYVLRAAQ